jgi:cytoskeletal protein CcmA (bactofilin family)
MRSAAFGLIGRRWFRFAVRPVVAVIALLLLVNTAAAQIPADDVSDFVVFGNNAVTYQGFTNSLGAPVGTNGDLNHQAGVGNFDALFGGGILNGANTNARQRVAGDVIFNDSVRINELSRVGGDLHSFSDVLIGASGDGVIGGIVSLGSVDLGAFNPAGSIAADGNVTLRPSARVLGNVGSNGDVSLEIAAQVIGHVTHAGTLTVAPLATVGSSSVGSTVVLPRFYPGILIPITPTPPVSLAPPIVLPLFANQTLAPGQYSDLILQGSNDVFLSAGDYYFNNINMTGTFADLHLDLTGGPIRIFVNDDVSFDRLSTFINGVAQDSATPSLAANVVLEAHGNIRLSGEFFGGVFAPKGIITLDAITDVVGAVVASDEVIAESSANVSYVRNSYLTTVPEPSVFALGVLGLAAVCVAWRRTRTIAS